MNRKIQNDMIKAMEENPNLDEDGSWKDKKELRKLQMALTEMLAILDKTCKNHKIQYVMFAGTLLGAVRHKGFIPWDNDMDIAVPREDFEKLERILKKELPPHLKVQTSNTDKGYYMQLMKVKNTKIIYDEVFSLKGCKIEGAYIDVFPLDDSNKEYSIKMSIQALLVKKILAIMSRRSDGKNVPGIQHDTFIRKTADFFAGLRPRSKWMKLCKKIMMWGNKPHAKYFINLCSHYNYKKQVFLKDKIFPAIDLEFEGYQFKAPVDCDYVLKKFYGNDYMKIPKPKDRHMEGHNLKRLKVGE